MNVEELTVLLFAK